MIHFNDALSDILAMDANDFYERDPETFFASQMGFCPRQLYLLKLGLTASSERQGQYRVTRLIQDYLEKRISDQYQHLETEVSFHIDEGPITFIGRCNLVDPREEVAYALKTRNGWYKFSPPVERHLDQLHIYMRGIGVEHGKLVYVSKNDLADVREWPPQDGDHSYVTFEQDRYDQLVSKANQIRETIWSEGIATARDEIPFQTCGCYFCREESLAFPGGSDNNKNSDHSTEKYTSGEKNPSNQSTASVNTPSGRGNNPTTKVDGGKDTTVTHSGDTTVLNPDGTHVPDDLRNSKVWVVWDGQAKVARAPWQEGTMYPCEWAAAKDVDPRRSYEKAQMVAELPIREIHRAWPFPDGDSLPERVKPAILLPHDPPSPPLAFVDFDDVRDPATGEVPDEVVELIDMLGGYAEISRSGTGVHVYVRGSLPDEIGVFAAPLIEQGTIEIYDHSRFTGGTWRHLKGTARDTVPESEDAIIELVTRYR